MKSQVSELKNKEVEKQRKDGVESVDVQVGVATENEGTQKIDTEKQALVEKLKSLTEQQV